MNLPSAVYTAVRGYAWSRRPEGISDETLEDLFAAASEARGDFADEDAVTTGVVAVRGTAAAFSIRRAQAWDSEGRDADYAAFAFVPCEKADAVDFAEILTNGFFTTPMRTPPTSIAYEGPGSAAAPLVAAGRLLCHRKLDAFDPHAIGALLAAHAAHCDRWLFLLTDGSCRVTTAPWHK